ncbi:MAG: two-component system sensor histidine kinase NtrB [Myxococcota bacterium]
MVSGATPDAERPTGADEARSVRALLRPRAFLLVWAPIVGIAAVHLLTPPSVEWVHGVARRLCYLPIILGAFEAGLLGGIVAATVTTLAYAPHAWMMGAHGDPAGGVEKGLEVVVYFAVAAVSGALIDRERRERRRQQLLAERLQTALDRVHAAEAQLVRAAGLHALGELSAGLAHEIRNPLHAMRGTAEILLDAVPVQAPERPLAEAHVREIDRLSGVLGRFLEFARPREARMGPVDLAAVARQVADLLRAQASQAGVELVVTAPDPLVARGDHDQLVQVVLGIGINGLQATGRGGRVSLSVVDVRRGAARWRGIVADNDGPPIPEELLPRIFEPFVSGRAEGTGLGLAVASRIVDAHAGLLEGENQPGGRGVTFRVLLPLGSV